jgi:hypothetical protein
MREHFAAFGGSARSKPVTHLARAISLTVCRTACLGQNIARLEILHAISKFFKRFPNVALADTATAETIKPIDFFVFKPTGGKFEVSSG